MNRTAKMAALLVMVATFSFSQEQENEIRFGIRVASNSSFALSEGGDIGEPGPGFAVGAVASIPITGIITFNPELNLIYRQPLVASVPKSYYYSPWGGGIPYYETVYVTEFAISVPALFQLMPFGGPVFYLETGIQLDIPFVINEPEDIFGKYPNRAAFDFGVPFGLGWHIGKHFVIDSRIIVGLTSIGEREKDLSLVQSELGLLYLF